MNWILSKFKSFDIPLLVISGLLLLVGLTIQYAISFGEGSLAVFYRQLIASGLAVVLFLIFANNNYVALSKANRIAYILLIVALLYLVIFGDPIRGSARWIDFGFYQLQPAEFAKVIVAIGLSRWLYLRRGQVNSLWSFAGMFAYALLPALLIMLEPDLGSSMVVMSIWFGLLLISPIRKTFIVGLLIAGLIFAGFSWEFVLKDYQKQRVEVFLNPDKDPRGKGYNVRQAIIAVGSGQILGRGLGQGVQSQLKFLPEKHTDFVFASSSEEIGFVGSAAILFMFYIMFWRIIKIMSKARNDLAMYLAGAILFFFASQFVINVGMNIGLLPVTGIPLPFITYGGSSLISVAIALGIVQNIAKQSKVLRF